MGRKDGFIPAEGQDLLRTAGRAAAYTVPRILAGIGAGTARATKIPLSGDPLRLVNLCLLMVARLTTAGKV